VEEVLPAPPPIETPIWVTSAVPEPSFEAGKSAAPVEVVPVEPSVKEPEPPAPEPVPSAIKPEPPVREPEPSSPPVEVTAPPPEAFISVGEPAPPTNVVAFPPSAFDIPAAVVDVVPPKPSAPPAPPAFDISELSEADQKLHKDARRFAKLLVSEIELYNKGKVADGRKNRDLYKRLRSDIERSRQTFEKRFGKSLNKQFDYFHEELVKTLAASDVSVLGSEYPGPSA
jgi:hypothetical protein